MPLEEVFPGSPPQGRALGRLLKELAVQTRVADGAAPATNIPVPGAGVEDTLAAVLYLPTDPGPPVTLTDVVDVTGEASITSAGNIRLSTTDTTDGKLVVFWHNKP